MLGGVISILGLTQLFAVTTIQSYICQPPDEPAITRPVEGTTVTNSSVVLIEGNATTNATVSLTDNGTPLATLLADQHNHFGLQTVLEPGTHSLGISVQNPCGSNVGSNVSFVVNEPPSPASDPTVEFPTFVIPQPVPQTAQVTTNGSLTLSILSPLLITQTAASSIYVVGETSKPTTFTVRLGDTVIARLQQPSTSFGVNVPVNIGINTITITASSGDSQVSQVIRVTRVQQGGGETPLAASPDAPIAIEKEWHQTITGQATIASIGFVILLIIIVLLFL